MIADLRIGIPNIRIILMAFLLLGSVSFSGCKEERKQAPKPPPPPGGYRGKGNLTNRARSSRLRGHHGVRQNRGHLRQGRGLS